MLQPPADRPFVPPPAVAAPEVDPMRTVPFRVTGLHVDNEDTFTLELAPPPGHQLAPFKPGQFNMLYVFGVGEVPISISGDPDLHGTLVHTTREVGAVTRAMRGLQIGDAIGVRGPFGSSWPVEAAEGRDVVLIAGGIGLPPLRPALYHVLARRERYGRVVLLYGARTPEDLMFPEELAKPGARCSTSRCTSPSTAPPATGGATSASSRPRQARADRPAPHGRDDLRPGGHDPLRLHGARAPRRQPAGHLRLARAQHEVRRRPVRPLPAGPHLVCRDGPVFSYDQVERMLDHGEV
jgi:NAD(P)H-flavin reductase